MGFRALHMVLILMIALLNSACNDVVLILDDVPSNTPESSTLFVTGDFNYWDPGDNRYALKKIKDSLYYISLPRGFGEVEFKFTRGDWRTEEKDLCGNPIGNRKLAFGEKDTVFLQIGSWSDLEAVDCEQVTVVVKQIPKNTPAAEPIHMVGNFSGWSSNDSTLLKPIKDSIFAITIPRPPHLEELEFKFNRGDWSSVEVDSFGKEIPRRKIKFGASDTVELDIVNWEDLTLPSQHTVTFVIRSLPPKTPRYDKIYLVGNFNGWFPRDPDLILERSGNGAYSISVPKRNRVMEYKFTRGGWETVEGDKKNRMIDNRVYRPWRDPDTIYVDIAGWEDFRRNENPLITLIVENIPEDTPARPEIFITGDFNGWDPGDRSMRLNHLPDGRFFIRLPKRDGRTSFKFTRGSWATVEGTEQGFERSNRVAKWNRSDTLRFTIASWEDIHNPKVTVVLRNYPPLPSTDQPIYLAGNFNDWRTNDQRFKMKKSSDGSYILQFNVRHPRLEYKFTLGSWSRSEVLENGDDSPNRVRMANDANIFLEKVERWRNIPIN